MIGLCMLGAVQLRSVEELPAGSVIVDEDDGGGGGSWLDDVREFLDVAGGASEDVARDWAPTVAAAVGAGVGALLWSGHPILGLLNGAVVAGNAARVATRKVDPESAVENVGAHLAATAGSLALPGYPLIGYVAGAIGARSVLNKRETAVGDALGQVDAQDPSYRKELDAVAAEVHKLKADADQARVADTDWFKVHDEFLHEFYPYASGEKTGFFSGSILDAGTRAKYRQQLGGWRTRIALQRERMFKKALPAPAGQVPTSTDVALDRPTLRGEILPKGTKPGEEQPGRDGALIWGRPAWQVLLAIVGAVLVVGGIFAARGGGS